LARQGKTVSEIARQMEADRKTVRKYLEIEDFSEPLPMKMPERPSILDPYKDRIVEILESDKKRWHKQTHSAKRIWEILVKEEGHLDLEKSYQTIQRFVKVHKQASRRESFGDKGTMKLVWFPGEAQCDFGQADFYIEGVRKRMYYLVLSFPHSNKCVIQLFESENAECVCQGLLDIFEFLGGIPVLIIFDNATGIGKRIGDKIRQTELFARFRLHYRFEARFCNPDSGHEKGNVETAVRYVRRHLFVPEVVIATSVAEYNGKHLLSDSYRLRHDEPHYLKGIETGILFEADRKALRELPHSTFNVERHDVVHADGYGFVATNAGKHRYQLGSEFSRAAVVIGYGAWEVRFWTAEGRFIKAFRRRYGDEPTESIDLLSTLRDLVHKPNAWSNSHVRYEMEAGPFKAYLDGSDGNTRRRGLYLFNEVANSFGFGLAAIALNGTCRNGSVPEKHDVLAYANRLTSFPLSRSENATGVDLSMYDQLLGRKEAAV
jgi:transposase